MYSVLLIDADPIRAFDLFIGLEDEGFTAFGPISSSSEGFRHLKNETLDAIIIDPDTARNYFPELYTVVMESNTPIVFLGHSSGIPKSKNINAFCLKDRKDIGKLRAHLDILDAPTSLPNAMPPEIYAGVA